MTNEKMPAQEELQKKGSKLYHHVNCEHLQGLQIKLTAEGQDYKKFYSIIGLSSKETIRTGLKMVDASPFKTVFIVDEASGKVLFALSKNEDYVKAAKKKKKPTPPPDLPPPSSPCCQICYNMGGYACDSLSDGSCICYGSDRASGGNNNPDAPLETLAF